MTTIHIPVLPVRPDHGRRTKEMTVSTQETITIEIPRRIIDGLQELEGCSDGNCVLLPANRGGQHTNGGCSCGASLFSGRREIRGPLMTHMAMLIGIAKNTGTPK